LHYVLMKSEWGESRGVGGRGREEGGPVGGGVEVRG